MAGYLLARAGLRVTVLEKHADFLRDFRGDTIHPSTITLLGELGLRERFLELPVTRLSSLDTVIDGQRMTMIDFSTLRPPDNFLVLAPQWSFLDFLAREAAVFPGFELRMCTEATEIVTDGDRVVGVRARITAAEPTEAGVSAADCPAGNAQEGNSRAEDSGARESRAANSGTESSLAAKTVVEFRAPLTVAADGRTSQVRRAAGLMPIELGVAIDVLWFSLPKPSNPPPPTLGYLDGRSMVLTIDRGDHYQGGLVIPKGGFDTIRADGLGAFRRRLTETAPMLAPVVGTIQDWDQVRLLSVQVDRLSCWYRDGLICIGDAAHAMSPVGGVGVNYAIQDAVVLANRVAGPLLHKGSVPLSVLDAVQRRRARPVRPMQWIQRQAHARVGRGGFPRDRALPRAARAVLSFLRPVVCRVTARAVGRGFLPEHVQH